MKVKFIYAYPIDIDIETEKDVEVYIDAFPVGVITDNTIRVVILEEPARREVFDLAQQYPDHYTHLLTFQEDLLATNPKAKLFHCTNTWVKGYIAEQKKFCVSTVVGWKDDPQMRGYAIRHNLWRNRHHITMPKEFYLTGVPKPDIATPWLGDPAGNLILGASKTPMFDSMFHISIENTSIKHYFSEKLIDCFQTKTVPLYCGCTNIGDYFNTEGMFIVNSVAEIVTVCNHLTPEVYHAMLPAMEDNYNRSQKWTDGVGQIKDAIINLIR
jgi:hypothetical protein